MKRQESAFQASHDARVNGSQCPGPEREREERTVGPHLAGVPALRPSTKHVILDDPGVAIQGKIGLVLLLTVLVSHNGDGYFPQVVGWG